MSSVLVVGSIAYDSIETAAGKRDEILGGSATYFSTAASLLAPVRVVAVVGSDFGRHDLDFLMNRSVDFSGVQTQEGKTFRWGGRYSQDFSERQTLFTQLNVFESFNPIIPEAFKKSEFVFLANIGPELQLHVLEQIERPRFIAMDTMNFWIDRSLPALMKVLKNVDGLIINDEEARMLTGEMNLLKAIQQIREMGPRVIVVKKGEHGAVLSTEKGLFFLPAFPIEHIVDPTGAGDTFAGGFMGYLAAAEETTDEMMRNAVVVGSAMASFCVEGFGTERLREIPREAVLERYRQFRTFTSFADHLEVFRR